MKQKNLYLMCGPAGSGKTTWVNTQMANATCKCIHISRDVVRNTFLTDEDKNMFAYEDDVFDEFCRQVEAAIEDESGADAIFVDATHLSEKARNRVLDKLNLENVDIYPVVFNLPLYQVLNQNEQRRGKGRTYVPRSVIRRMYAQFSPPTDHEKYKYKKILKIGDGE